MSFAARREGRKNEVIVENVTSGSSTGDMELLASLHIRRQETVERALTRPNARTPRSVDLGVAKVRPTLQRTSVMRSPTCTALLGLALLNLD